MKKGSIILFIAMLLGVAYATYIVRYVVEAADTVNTATAAGLGKAMGITLLLPHTVMAVLAAVFSFVSAVFCVRWSALVAGILYAVAAALMLMYAPFVAVQMILSFIGFVRMRE